MALRPEKIVNLLTAILVLVAGMYVLIFLPLPTSPLVKVIIGILILIYFLWRVRYFVRRYGNKKEGAETGHDASSGQKNHHHQRLERMGRGKLSRTGHQKRDGISRGHKGSIPSRIIFTRINRNFFDSSFILPVQSSPEPHRDGFSNIFDKVRKTWEHPGVRSSDSLSLIYHAPPHTRKAI